MPQITDTLMILGNSTVLKAGVPGRHVQISAPCEINDLSFIDGSALLTGGALRALASAVSVRFNRCHFGALQTDCPAEFYECSFLQNSSDDGSGIATKEGILPVSVFIESCSFVDHTASAQGTAIHLDEGTLMLQSASFQNSMGPFGQDIFIKVGSNTGIVELLPEFEARPVQASLTIGRS